MSLLDNIKKQSDLRQCLAHWFILFGVPAILGIGAWVLAETIRNGRDIERIDGKVSLAISDNNHQESRIERLETMMLGARH